MSEETGRSLTGEEPDTSLPSTRLLGHSTTQTLAVVDIAAAPETL